MSTVKRAAKKAPTRRPGGRSARVVHSVLEAALDELAAHGYSGISIEGIAERAGVAKTTIYRRWPTKGELISAALSAARGDDGIHVDTGSLRQDLEHILLASLARTSTPRGKAIARGILGGFDDPELAAITRALRARQPLIPNSVIEHAISRGELPDDVDSAWLTELLVSPMHIRVVFKNEPVDLQYIRRLIDIVVSGLVCTKIIPSARQGETRFAALKIDLAREECRDR